VGIIIFGWSLTYSNEEIRKECLYFLLSFDPANGKKLDGLLLCRFVHQDRKTVSEGSKTQKEKALSAFAEEIGNILKKRLNNPEPLRQEQLRKEIAGLYRLGGYKVTERPDECLEVKESRPGSLRTITTLVGYHTSDK
jgi:hypothetical protein